jgi:hypothetical protein
MSVIPGRSRLDARRIARRCVCALIEAAETAEDIADPDAFLRALLSHGHALA